MLLLLVVEEPLHDNDNDDEEDDGCGRGGGGGGGGAFRFLGRFSMLFCFSRDIQSTPTSILAG